MSRRSGLPVRDEDCPDCTPWSCPCSEPEPPEPPGVKPDVEFLRRQAEQERKEAS